MKPKTQHDSSSRAFRAAPNPTEVFALDQRLFSQPGAFGLVYEVPPACEFDPASILPGGLAVLRLSGPIEHHSSWYWASYEDLALQVELAMANDDVRAVTLRIDSPGGLAAGMGEAHRALRRLADASGKPLLCYVDETACSAAYHVASACDEIWGPPASVVGSIGVICCAVDETERLEQSGIRVRYVVSGARKADLHPGSPVDEKVLAVAQEKVDFLAGRFFQAVARARSLTPEFVDSLQAGTFFMEEAVDKGLADGVASWPDFLDLVRESIGATVVTTIPARPTTMKTKLQIQQALADVTAKIEAARDAIASPSTTKTARAQAMTALESALREKIALAAEPQATTTTVRQLKHEEREVVKDDGEQEEKPKPDDEPEPSDPGTSTPASTGSEEEEEEAALAKAYDAAERAFHAELAHAPQALKLYSPTRMRRLARQVTGQRGVRSVFGALDGVGQKLAQADKLSKRIEKLEARERASAVEALVATACAEGKLLGEKRIAAAKSDGERFGVNWLQGHLATLPKQVRTLGDGPLRASMDEDGAPILSADQEKIIAQATTGLSPDEADRMRKRILADAAKTGSKSRAL